MSRMLLACSLVAVLSGSAFAKRIAPAAPPPPPIQFAKPPPGIAVHPGNVPVDLPRPIVVTRATVRAALLEKRAQSVAWFHAYQAKGVFPNNTYSDSTLNVWKDLAGNFCAAATIMRSSGAIALVDRIAEQNNFIRLADVRQGPVMDWILTSGLTQEEIVAIQVPFAPVVDTPTEDPTKIVARKRGAEDARLMRRYQRVDAMLARNTNHSLDIAVDRLMKHRDLAWRFVNNTR
ncbi:MAG: hypothetical protein AB7O24_16080 [Kofleriaceae bacterium]